jgi:cryptochrome
MPKQYIYEPWTAPLSVQEKARCIIGKDYPKPGEKKLIFSDAESI